MTLPDLRADCARCAALCCAAFAFDRSTLFAFDKPAGQPCRHLGDCGTCGIHADRGAQGMGGCVAYDCLGAGQRVTQSLFGGRSWLQDSSLLDPMTEAFLIVARAPPTGTASRGQRAGPTGRGSYSAQRSRDGGRGGRGERRRGR